MAKPGGEDGIEDKDAKHVLDEFGQQVYDQVKGEAEAYKDELEGSLSQVSVKSETGGTNETCELVQKYYKRVNDDDPSGKRYPCKQDEKGNYVDRFSDKEGAECATSKIKDSNNYRGACAPYRRLSVCDRNLEQIQPDQVTTTDNLLLEVCMAAYYEGDSIKTRHRGHQLTNVGTSSQLCTVLARSFADIGDIVRGRDLFYGNTQEKTKRKQLDKKLKEIFKNIYKELTTTRGKNGKTNVKTLEARYKDRKDPDFFKLREDWWYANRAKVWYAMTCGAPDNAKYFRPTCGSGPGAIRTPNQCRCSTRVVPTYFDYVPQYLRWFEEWAEDFCRKRKHKLQNAITNCRGQDGTGKEKYCDLNRHNCKKTIRGDERFVEESDCHDCSVACAGFVKWIDKQKVEFDKQKRKYADEMKKYTNGESRSTGGAKRKKGDAGKSNYDGYEKKFYGILKTGYNNVNNFLEKLNEEDVCKKINDEEEGTIDFKTVNSAKNSDGNNKTFSHTEYCQACPWCGVKEQNGKEKWEANDDRDCKPGKDYTNYKNTQIPILTPQEQPDIFQKYKSFCNSETGAVNGGGSGGGGASGGGASGVAAGGSVAGGTGTSGGENGKKGGNKEDNQIKTWTCYYKKKNEKDDVNGDINFCVLQDDKARTSQEKSMHYNAFFWKWVYHMLHDSVEWRERLNSCINKNKENTCKTPKKCNKECTCFAKWVVKKKEEWGKIKKHFDKQENIPENCYFTILEFLLKKEELLEIIEGTYGKPEEIKNLREMLEQAGVGDVAALAALGDLCTTVGDKDNTTIDKFLQEELKDANRCKDCQDPPKQPAGGGGGPGRADFGTEDTPARVDLDDDSSGEEDEEDSEEEELENDVENVDQEKAEGEQVEEPPAPTDHKLNVCETVKTALTIENLTQACQQKYQYGKEKYTNWKCISDSGVTATSGVVTTTTKPGESGDRSGRNRRSVTTTTSGATTSDKGAICVPPRRRRLYVGKLEQWAGIQLKSQVGGDGDSSSSSSSDSSSSSSSDTQESKSSQGPTSPSPSHPRADDLRDAFIQSAAIETFFLWHKYKVDKAREKKEKNTADGEPVIDTSTLGKEHQEKLERGDIPDDFLRQMFYTLGDYRDICIGVKQDVIEALKASGDNNIETIQKKIKEILNGENEQQRGQQSNSVNDPKSWWDQNGEHIWKGMICALTYKENSEKTIVKDGAVYDKFFGTTPNNPIPKDNLTPGPPVTTNGTTGTQNGTYKETYDYSKVVLKDDDDQSGAKETSASAPSDTPLLTNFISRPPYFRYLEEWGEEFCRKQKHKLYIIKKDCRGKDGDEKCSGDGLKCTEPVPDNDKIFHDFNCQSCAKSCRFYKKWINTKKKEYEKQKEEYSKQKDKCEKESNNHDNGFCGTLKDDAAEFLERLKSGPCSKKDNEEDDINFKEPNVTFKYTKHCDPCSEFKINCRNGDCNDVEGTKCDGKTPIGAKEIEKIKKSTEDVVMLVSDNSATEFKGDLQNDCQHAGIFKGIKENKWECRKVCGVDICTLEKENNNGEESNEHIIVKELLKRWLEYFFEDYNRIQKKLRPCIENGKECTCQNKCDKKCNCVEKWIGKKRTEWHEIKKDYLEQYKSGDDGGNTLINFLEELIPRMDLVNDKGKINELKDFLRLYACKCSDNSESGKHGTQKDIVECLLNKLEEKAKTCKEKHSGQTCSPAPPETPDDDDEPLEEENPVTQPNICPKPPEPKAENEGDCNPAQTTAEEKPAAETEAPKPEQTPPAPAPAPAPAPRPPRRPKHPNPFEHPAVIPSLVTSTLAWSVGIGFAAFTYFFLKVLYIYIYIYIYMFVCICVFCICMCWYDWIYIYGCICMCFIYIFYIYLCIYIEKEKKKKKKRNIKTNLLK